MTWVVSHYQSDYSWVKQYTDSFIVYHKDRVNVGYNISTILSFIIDNYDHLPDVTIFVKDNLLERHITKGEFDQVVNNTTFTPLLTKNHKVYEPICRYVDGVYEELNNSWYFNEHPYKYFKSYEEFTELVGIPSAKYLRFAPGGNYIVPKENILKHPKSFYKILLEFVSWSQINAESHAIERALYTIFT